MKKQVINLLLENNGNLPEGKTWYQVGIENGIKPPNKKRAKVDEKYERNSIAKATQDYWRQYLKRKENLKLVKETYHKGELVSETYRKEPKKIDIDLTGLSIDGVTTNPHGGAWIKYKNVEVPDYEEHFEKIKEILVKEIKPYPAPLPSKIKDKYGVFVYGSDKHVGALTLENSIYKNTYDKEEIRKRIVGKTLDSIFYWVDNFGLIDSLFIMDLGDALDGYNGKTTRGNIGKSVHTLPQQYSNIEQHDIYLEVHKELFDTLVEYGIANNIYFIATSNSNHGGDFEYGAMRNLETYLNIKYPFIKTFVSTTFLNHFFYGDHCIIFSHGGDTEDLKSNFPLTLNDKTRAFISNYIRVNDLQQYKITVVSGDLHQSAETYCEEFRYKKALSQLGNVKWGHNNFGFGFPGLSTELFFHNSDTIFKNDILFDFKNKSNTGIDF